MARSPVSASTSYEEAKEGVSRYVEESLQEMGELTSWDLSFAEYIEEHKNSKLLFCWYDSFSSSSLSLTASEAFSFRTKSSGALLRADRLIV